MDKLYAPWRSSYVTDVNRKKSRTLEEKDCVFCTAFKSDEDAKYFILKRANAVVVILNLYPYAGGHIMVLPVAHHGELFELDQATRAELLEEVNNAIEILKKAISPHGFNVGINVGTAGGGGIPSHLHVHVLPRWNGDTNFMPLLSDTRPVSCSLEEIYQILVPFFKMIK
jgi:ATP adenylyltransferase